MAKSKSKAKKAAEKPKPKTKQGESKQMEAATATQTRDPVAVQSSQSAVEPSPQPATTPQPKTVDLDKPAIKEAIAKGLALIKEGKSKADAARAMYGLIKDEPKEVIVAAFVVGATLTEKGALTYWYNTKRRAEKEAKAASQ